MGIFEPFRAIGYITTGGVPFSLQRLGTRTFVTVSVGKAFHVYNLSIHSDTTQPNAELKHGLSAENVTNLDRQLVLISEILAMCYCPASKLKYYLGLQSRILELIHYSENKAPAAKLLKGNLRAYRYCDSVWTFNMRDMTFKIKDLSQVASADGVDSGDQPLQYMPVLVVVQVYDGLERVVFYLSRRMLDAETRYPEIEKLCLCLFFTCTKLHHILWTAEIVVICKSDVIKHMLSAPVLKGRLGKWMFALSEFDIRYQPAKAVKGQALADLIAERINTDIAALNLTKRGPAPTASDGRGSHLKAHSMGWTYPPRQKNAPGRCVGDQLHGGSFAAPPFESLVNTLERVALRVIQEIMSHQYSPSGPALGTHQGEALLHSRPPLPFALAAPEAPNSSAYVVYKIGGDPSDYQFLQDAPKEIPHGYACAYVPDCSTWAPSNQVAIAGTSGATGGTSETDPEKQTWLAKYATPTKLPSPAPAGGSEPEKQAWLVKYATPTNLQGSAPAAITADQICTILKDQFGMMPKRKAIGYTKPYPNEYELIPLPPKYRLPDFTKFSGSDGSSSIEHVSRYLAQLGMISASDELRVRYFSVPHGSAFGWYTSLPPNSIQTGSTEERFHEQYHSEASEAGIADLAQRKEAVELAVVGLSSSIKEVASQADYPSLAHMVQKLSAYEQRHPDIYQDKFKRVVTMVDAGEDEGPTGEREVAVAEWTRAAGPVTCKWVKPPGPPRGFDFDVTKTEQIFDLLLAEKHIKVPEGHKFPTVQELNGKPYCKWHNTFTHTTNDCRVWRQQIQVAIENGRLIFNQYAMKVDTHPFPAVNMVEFTHLGGCQPDFSANISMVELGHRSEKDGDEDSCSQSKDTEGAAPCDRLRQDGKRYVTEGEVKNIRYQRPLSDHLLNKYVSRYDQSRRYNNNDERGRLTRNDGRHRRHNQDEERQERHGKEQDDTDRHWHCPFFDTARIQE
ncbi:hypothetical protein QYE76_007681 [Lolium multiflorum]|uniref:Reverse transcriptase RNase H-like domain-containing protein n=1 Tax=Lolium multiflorum TaxID=4521 RepID=A0AAD8PH04_LOLMU|nr:hypothetical protein QYE76_007681 [Lolium multiflorum]